MNEIVWRPSAERIAAAQLTAYRHWLHETRGLAFGGYEELWQWSCDSLEDFWQSIWDYFGFASPTPYAQVLDRHAMPGREVVRRRDAELHRRGVPQRPRRSGRRRHRASRDRLSRRGRRPARHRLGRTRTARRVARGDPDHGRRRGRRPRRGLPAERARDDRRVPRGRERRRRMVGVRARHGTGRRPRPVPADRAGGDDRVHRLSLRRQGLRPRRDAGRSAGRAADGPHGDRAVADRPRGAAGRRARDAPDAARRALPRLGRLRRVGGCAARVHAGAVRASAVDRLFQRHDRDAEGDRPRPRRRRAGRHQGHAAAARRRAPRPLPLVLEQRLDHVELAGQRAARRRDRLHLRRQRGVAPTGTRCGASRPSARSTSSAPARPSTRRA